MGVCLLRQVGDFESAAGVGADQYIPHLFPMVEPYSAASAKTCCVPPGVSLQATSAGEVIRVEGKSTPPSLSRKETKSRCERAPPIKLAFRIGREYPSQFVVQILGLLAPLFGRKEYLPQLRPNSRPPPNKNKPAQFSFLKSTVRGSSRAPSVKDPEVSPRREIHLLARF